MRDATLCFLVQGDPPHTILLGLKKAGFGAGKYNGFGGKIENGETPALAAIRELWEECGARVALEDLRPVAYLDFRFPAQPAWDQVVHVFLAARWEGTPAESAEMAPAWFSIDKLPRQRMWQDDPHWLPRVLAGERIRARFVFKEDNETVDQVEFLGPLAERGSSEQGGMNEHAGNP